MSANSADRGGQCLGNETRLFSPPKNGHRAVPLSSRFFTSEQFQRRGNAQDRKVQLLPHEIRRSARDSPPHHMRT
jgi:hypothetical protein